VKNCILTQTFTEIGQWAAELWPKTILKWGYPPYLSLKKFLLRHGDFTICNMAAVGQLQFSKFRVYVMSDDQLLSYGQTDF